ncbi:NucA/NucB deoxyribonuclease domain-containing protein [Rhizobium halophytocola]|uniref:Type IV secretory pathway TrbL component n=1 Tax=Rhizobium halophytocola TaxID=735519 RepID=A0ABS4E695_9HYPH|nr:NucA/NucB deoxyribonuclease domain-containing protein [Rhizobium halophytocola]MBP1853433.1 type IV secretory pathway TrbL component [Rhizobium halophytocola]
MSDGGFFENLLGGLGLVGGGAVGAVEGAAAGAAVEGAIGAGVGAAGGALAGGVGAVPGAAGGAVVGGGIGAVTGGVAGAGVGAAGGYAAGTSAGAWVDDTDAGRYVNQKIDDARDWLFGNEAADQADAKADTDTCQTCPCARSVVISRTASPQAAQHIADAQASGYPSVLTLDRPGTTARRAASLRGIPTKPGMDRDEYPPATFAEGGAGASVRHIPRSDNRSAGGQIAAQLTGATEGCKITMTVGP